MVLTPMCSFSEKSNGAFVATIQDSNGRQNDSEDDNSDGKDKTNRQKHERRVAFEPSCSFEGKFDSFTSARKLRTDTSRRAEAEVNALDYSEGWQERLLYKAREVKEKHLERKRKVLQKRLVDKHTLEEKRCLVELYGSSGTYRDTTHKSEDQHQGFNQGDPGINMDKRHESCGINVSKEDRIEVDNHQAARGSDLKHVRSSYENFKNNPVIIQPYRLEKFNPTKDDVLLQDLNLDLETAELPDQLQDLISRPKSAPSIPSKCRKYVLVGSESDSARDRPAPTPMEEMLMSERFPTKSNLGQVKSRSCSPFVPQIRRPRSLQKLQKIDMSCK